MLNDVWVGSLNIRKLDEMGNYKLHIINVLPECQGMGIGQLAIKLVEELFPYAKKWYLETLKICLTIDMYMKRLGSNLLVRLKKLMKN